MQSSFPLQYFSIEKLFGKYNIHIDFDKVNIFVGDNGIGKTTVLSCIYYVLAGKFDKLTDIQFDNIKLRYENKDYTINREKILTRHYKYRYISGDYQELLRRDIQRIKRIYITKHKKRIPIRSFLEIDREISPYLHRILRFMPQEKLCSILEEELGLSQDLIPSFSEYDILYFPTYRRIEEDFSNIFERSYYRNMGDEKYIRFETADKEVSRFIAGDSLIQFGMDDVERAIKNILDELKKLAVAGFQNFTKKLFTRLFANELPRPPIKYTNDDIHNLSIIIERLNLSISQEQQSNVLENIKKPDFLNDYHNFFIRNLLDIYSSQKEYDTAIRAFAETCTSYFEDKKYIYNESNMELEIRNSANEVISLSQLSSGEKQIVSLFSKIFLTSLEKKKIVLFDEPELSLSVFWQKKLLPDIMNSGRCAFMVAVTHSPFIFENDLRDYASALHRETSK